ncbi:MAG: hypothetical protein ACLTUF_10980 [Waltera sp.]|uniref:hypothetical protein n=1 Tax=Waltera sp. TaxID=2815806 RepID=UPI00399323F2
MKMCEKSWRMKSLTGVILVCIFLTACGGETRETESKNVTQESITVSTGTIEQTDEQTQEATREAENIVQTDAILENLKGNRDPQVILQELSELPLNIEELKAYPVYVLSDQFEECSGAELLTEFYEQSTQGNPTQLLMANYLYNEKWILSYIEFDGSTYYMLRGDVDAGTAEEDYKEMYFHSLNIIEKKEIDQGMSLIMIVFTNQEDVSDEQAEQYVKWSEEGKRPDDIEIYYFLNLRYGLMNGDDDLKILDEVERTADRMAVYRLAKDFANTYFQEEYTGEAEIMGIKGLSGVDTDSKGDCTVEVEFRPVQEDSLSYLFMTFGYDEMGWTIRSYGLEK